MSSSSFHSKRSVASSSTSLDAAGINAVLDARKNCKRRRLAWFNTKPGRDLRLRVPTHVKFDGPRVRYAICNLNNSRNVGDNKPPTSATRAKLISVSILPAQPFVFRTVEMTSTLRARCYSTSTQHRSIRLRLHL